MIILNEKEYAEECLRNGMPDNKPFITLSILAKYYYQLGYKRAEIVRLLIDYIQKHYPYYRNNKLSWDESIEKIATKERKHTLFEIDGIWVTTAELDTIKNIHNKVLERLAFTMLCIAKLNNEKRPQNNGWVNVETKKLFSLARISGSVASRYERLNILKELGLIEFPKKNDNLNSRIMFINNESDKVLFVSDFRELGYEYLKFNGGDFIRCQDCGILVHNNKTKTKKYCPACVEYSPIKTKRVVCVDCGEEFEISAKNNKTCRCENCQRDERNKKKKIWMNSVRNKS